MYCMVVAESAVISSKQEGLHHITALHILRCCAKSPFLEREVHNQYQSAAEHCVGWGDAGGALGLLHAAVVEVRRDLVTIRQPKNLKYPASIPAPLVCVTLGSTKISASVKWGKMCFLTSCSHQAPFLRAAQSL